MAGRNCILGRCGRDWILDMGMKHEHRWSGDQDFRMNRQLCGEEVAVFSCKCGARTWLTRPQWNEHRGTWKRKLNVHPEGTFADDQKTLRELEKLRKK